MLGHVKLRRGLVVGVLEVRGERELLLHDARVEAERTAEERVRPSDGPTASREWLLGTRPSQKYGQRYDRTTTNEYVCLTSGAEIAEKSWKK